MRAKSAFNRKDQNYDIEAEQQNQKNKILDEDRKNFWRQAEEIKEKNKQEIEKLKLENKRLKDIRDQFISNKKSKSTLEKHSFNLSISQSLGLTNIKDQNYLRRLLDKERHATKIKKNALFTLQDKLKEVQENKLGYIEENPLMRNIRILQNRLDKVMIKYNQAQSIQLTYQQVVKRLKEQRVGYDSQLAAIQNSLKGRQHDFEELLLLTHDATHAKQTAYAELKRFQQRRITVQEMRSKYVNSKKQQVSKELPQLTELPYKQDFQMTQNKVTNNYTTNYQQDQSYKKQQLQDYQQIFRKLKEVTGVRDANQIIQKFKTQSLTTSSLQQLKQSYKKKIEKIKQTKQQLRKQIQQNKFMTDHKGCSRRRLDQIENDLAAVNNQFERTNIKSQRLQNLLINVKAGIQHLKNLTSFYNYRKQGQSTSNTLIEQDLKLLNDKFIRMYDIVKNDPQYMRRNYKPSASAIHHLINDQHSSYSAIKKINNQDDSQHQLQDSLIINN